MQVIGVVRQIDYENKQMIYDEPLIICASVLHLGFFERYLWPKLFSLGLPEYPSFRIYMISNFPISFLKIPIDLRPKAFVYVR